MRITKISRMRNCRVFDDFSWPRDGNLDQFDRFNLIYGWNGSGKSTISEIFRNLEARQQPADGHVILHIDGADITGEDFPNPSSHPSLASGEKQLRVFNKGFVKDNVFKVGEDSMSPIFVFGDQSVSAQRMLSVREAELPEATHDLNTANQRLNDLDKQLRTHSHDAAKTINECIGNESDSEYRHYNATRYRARANAMTSSVTPPRHFRLSADERQRLIARQDAEQQESLTLINYEPVDTVTFAVEVSSLLERTALSPGAIDALLGDSALARWIREGLDLHDTYATDKCLYCDQLLPADRVASLRRHFDDQYDQLQRELTAAVTKRESAIAAVATVQSQMPAVNDFYPELAGQYREAHRVAEEYFAQVTEFLSHQVTLLKRKMDSLHEAMDSSAPHATFDVEPLSRLADLIREHNTMCSAFTERKRDARQRLEAHFVSEYLPIYRNLTTEIGAARVAAGRAQRRIDHIRTEIDRLTQQARDHRRPARELNRDLRNYLGPGQLQVEAKDHGYTLTLNRETLQDPSEGEMTAIALLYFLKSLEGHDFDLKRGVVVLDDPVSSLDTNALYTALGFIRARTSDAGQLFILTHNWTFFREVKGWFSHVPGQGKTDRAQRPARFYMLQSSFRDGRRTSKISRLDPLLLDHESDYTYLFSRIHRAATEPTYNLEDNYPLPNIMRRFLEAFFAFKQPGPESLRDKLGKVVDFDEAKKVQILTFANSFSHNQIVDLPGHDSSILSESAAVARHVLDLIGKEDVAHLAGLKKELKRATENAGAE